MHIHEPAFNNESACDDRSRATINCDGDCGSVAKMLLSVIESLGPR